MAIQFRRGQAPDPNYVLKEAEPGFDLNTKTLKIGDGTTRWADLPSFGVSGEEIATAVTEYFEQNPVVGATTQYVEEAIASHENDATPHKAYDTDIPSLTLIFENGLV